ncbi:MAG: hypothetical protein ACE5Z5_07015 [Candidatus Bathyarchaeia archaeon]
MTPPRGEEERGEALQTPRPQALGQLKGYGRRWMVETAYSTFKGAFWGFCMAKTMENIARELVAKATIYNILVNM